MNKLKMLYNKQTNTHWVNDVNWEERHKTESMSYGTVDFTNINNTDIINNMKNDGYYLVDHNKIPWGCVLDKISVSMLQ